MGTSVRRDIPFGIVLLFSLSYSCVIRFLSDGRRLAPCLSHTLLRNKNNELPSVVKEAALECLVAKSGLGTAYISQDDLQEAQALLRQGEPVSDYLEAAISHRQSTLARLEAKYQYSLALSRWCCSSLRCHADKRLHAWHLHLFVSHLKTLNLQEKFEEAHEELKQWKIPSMSSLMERQVITSFSLVASEIERSLGRLNVAKEYLEDCYSHTLLLGSDSNRFQIICALIDVRCALGELEGAEYLVRDEIKKLGSVGGLSKALRRLQVSSLDVDIARLSPKSLVDAHSKIAGLVDCFDQMTKLDISDQLLHVRTLTASARIYHLQSNHSQAIQQWEKVKSCAVNYSAFRNKGFTFAFSQLSIGYAYMKVAGTPASNPYYQQYAQVASDNIAEANSVFEKEKDNYWIPLIVTSWLPIIRSEILNWQRLAAFS